LNCNTYNTTMNENSELIFSISNTQTRMCIQLESLSFQTRPNMYHQEFASVIPQL
jgi:hypothetical protein